jgi:hypothetical protein
LADPPTDLAQLRDACGMSMRQRSPWHEHAEARSAAREYVWGRCATRLRRLGRRRVQQAVHGHRGRKDDPLYSARRTLHTGAGLLTEKQKDRLHALSAVDAHVEVEATWGSTRG